MTSSLFLPIYHTELIQCISLTVFLVKGKTQPDAQISPGFKLCVCIFIMTFKICVLAH